MHYQQQMHKYSKNSKSKGGSGSQSVLYPAYNQIQEQQTIHYPKQVASKGATGRKGSMPSSFVQNSNKQQQQQPLKQHNFRPTNITIQKQGPQPGDKITGIKSHAKYFSQQNSPISKGQQQRIGEMIYQHNTIEQSTGNFGTVSHQAVIQNNSDYHMQNQQVRRSSSKGKQTYSQNQQNYVNHLKHQQQLPSKYSNSSINAAHSTNQPLSGGQPQQTYKYHSINQGPMISNAAGQQTVVSGNSMHGTQTLQSSHSNGDHKGIKQKYDESFLNGPLNEDERYVHNQSQQIAPNNHKRMMTTQTGQQQNQYSHQRASTAMSGFQQSQKPQSQMSKTDMRFAPKQGTKYSQAKVQKSQKFAQSGSLKSSLDKSQDVFQSSVAQLNFLNSNNIVLSQGQNIAIKSMKRAYGKAQTRPGSNSKNKQQQMLQNILHHQQMESIQKFDLKNTQNKKIKSQMAVQQQTADQLRQQAKRPQAPQTLIVPQNQIIQANPQQNHQFYQDQAQAGRMHTSNSTSAIIVNNPITLSKQQLQQMHKIQQDEMGAPRTIQHQHSQKIQQQNHYEIENQTLQVMDKNELSFSVKKQNFREKTSKETVINPQAVSGYHRQQNYNPHQQEQNMYHQNQVNNFQSNQMKQLKQQQQKSQKSSTTRLGSSNTRVVQGGGVESPNDLQEGRHHVSKLNNYGPVTGGMQTTSSKNSMKQLGYANNNKVRRENSGGYPYQSSSNKSIAKVGGSQEKKLQQEQSQNSKQNISIAQIFQQKGLNYKGPSKVVNQVSSNAAKVKSKLNANGVIVHTKSLGGAKGSLTTSANTAVNTAQNSPRILNNKNSMYIKNQQSIQSARRKNTNASFSKQQKATGGNRRTTLNSGNPSQSNLSNRHSTSQITQGNGDHTDRRSIHSINKNIHEFDDSQIQVTEVAYGHDTTAEKHKMLREIEPSKLSSRIGSQQSNHSNKMAHHIVSSQERHDSKLGARTKSPTLVTKNGDKAHKVEKEINGKNYKIQAAPQYMDGGTGSLINQKRTASGSAQSVYAAQRGIVQKNQSQLPQDFYTHQSQNIELKVKPNQHSNSVGQMALGQHSHQIPQLSSKYIKQSKLSNYSDVEIAKVQATQMKVQKKGQNILKNNIGIKNEPMTRGHMEQLMIYDGNYQPLITEEEEQEIRQVASDINEKAFYGKVLRTKQILSDSNCDRNHQFSKLSPRSQEIAYVMSEINSAFMKNGEAPLTKLDFYRIGKMLGRGAFGKVNLAMHKLVRKLVALKSLNKECLTDEVQKQKLMKEVNLLLKLRHDHVVKIYETIETKKHIIIVMELCAGGDLLNYVRKRRRLKEPYAKKIFKQIIDGLHYIHSKSVAHRDIKLDNILLDGKGSVKIADFGVSKQCQPGVKMREQCGTPAYIAPEILKNKNGYSYNVDLWSAGVVLFAMLYGTVPFKAGSMEELHSLILRGMYLLKDDISQEARDLLRGLLEINPHKRLTYDQIYAHPWLQDYDDSLELFNDQEREMIKKEYTYNDPSRYNRNENEDPIDCFTEHNIDSVYNTMKNASDKSIILAPFNSTQSDDFESFKESIQPMMMDKQLVIRLSRLCREVDRQYEFNNNGQLDNGVYHKQVNNSAEEEDGNKKKDKKKGDSDDEDDESRFQVIQCQNSRGFEFLTEDYRDPDKQQINKNNKDAFMNNVWGSMTEAERKLIESTFGTNREMEIDEQKANKLVNFGYPREYVQVSLQDNDPNYLTAGYYLLQMDQNYC